MQLSSAGDDKVKRDDECVAWRSGSAGMTAKVEGSGQ